MYIAVLVIILLLLSYILVTYILTTKNYSFDVLGNTISIQNRGAHLKIFLQGQIVEDVINPQLIKGEKYILSVDGKDVVLYCKSSNFGFKLRVDVEVDGKIIADNGVKLKEKKIQQTTK